MALFPIATIAAQNNLKIAQFANGLYGATLGKVTNDAVLADVAAVGLTNVLNTYYTYSFGALTDAQVAAIVAGNLGITAASVGGAANVTTATNYIAAQLAANPASKGAALSAVLTLWGNLVGDAAKGIPADPIYATAAAAWNTTIANAQAYTASGALADVLAGATGTPIYNLTTGVDAILGTANADLFQAMVLNNANSLQSGDVIDGGLGVDTLTAYMGNSAGFATIATTRNIENIDIQAQATPVDATNGNNVSNGTQNNTVTVDAQLMSGVQKWASVGSRADVIVEDVRINSNVTTIEFKESDPGNVDMGVYFNQRNLVNTTGGSSTLNIFLMDTAAASAAATAATPLLNHNFDSFSFYANGALVTLGGAGTAAGAAINAATTYAQLLAAFQSALTTATVGGVVTNLSATTTASLSAVQNMTTAAAADPTSAPVANSFLNLNGQVLVLTASGTNTITGTGAGTGWAASGVAPATGAIVQTFNSGATATAALVNTNIILDDVGMGSTGGDLVVGGMSVGATSASFGVERFNIEVRDNSKLQTINSTNDTLREVVITNGVTSSTSTAYVTTTANAGSLTVLGNANVTNAVAGQTTAQTGSDMALAGLDATHHGAYGFTDVRLIDASAMTGAFTFDAQITSNTINKYVNLVDSTGNALATADVATANTVGKGANFLYTGGANNDGMTVQIDALTAASRSTKVPGQSDFTIAVDGGAGNDTITVTVADSLNGAGANWYNNQNLNDNITINGGAGNDIIRTPGSGDTKIDAGAGNDVVYTDNIGTQALGATTGAVTAPSGKGIFVFNTMDQGQLYGNWARDIGNLRSDVDNSYNLIKGTLVVDFKGLPSATVTIAHNATTYKTTDFDINQAIKTAINTNATLSNLLVAKDGPAGSLVIESLIDGALGAGDLSVTIAAPTTGLTPAELTAVQTAWTVAAGAEYTSMATVVTSIGTKGDYVTAFATDNAGTNITGAASSATSDNFVTPGAGDDVIVLGTTVGADAGLSSNEVVTIAASSGNDVIVNFTATGAGIDYLDLSGINGVTLVTAAPGAAQDKSIWIVNDGGTAPTVAAIQALYTANNTAAQNHVYISVSGAAGVTAGSANVGTVYSIADAIGAGGAVATLVGTIDLANTAWNALTQANFTKPTATADGMQTTGITVFATANTAGVGAATTQTLTGTALADTLNGSKVNNPAAGTNTVIYNGGAGNDLYVGSANAAVVDTFNVTLGTDTIQNFTANDLLVVSAGATAALTVVAGAPGTLDLSVAGVTNNGAIIVTGNAGADTITGSAGVDTINAGAGADTIRGGLGLDAIDVGAADGAIDTVIITSALTANRDTIANFAVANDVLQFSIAGLGLNAGDYAAGATTAVNAAAAALLGAGAWANHVVVDTAAAIAALTVGAGSNAGGVLAIATDTGAISFDADGAFGAGAVLIGTVTGGGAFTAANLVIIA